MLTWRMMKSTAKVLEILDEFEHFCLGKGILSPAQYREMNEELSIGTVLHIGKCRLRKSGTEEHIFWVAPDKTEHDLGSIAHMNVMKDYPGFHKIRSLALGYGEIIEKDLIRIPHIRKNITKVTLHDGSEGYGYNYRIALRNAALRKSLRHKWHGLPDMQIWKGLGLRV